MDYQAALEYLYALTDYEKDLIDRYDPATFDLSRVRRVLARLGNPHQRFASIHVAGTKGKGSVAAMCASVLQATGLRTGLYTSPHLHTFRERIQVDGDLVPQDALTALVKECRSMFETEPELTTFEAITVLAFVYFARRQVDFAVIEVGLGGRLDATNVITPQVAVITSLSLDHTYLLGDSLADIAREKAGIIKPGVPTVCAPQDARAIAVIQQICDERGSPLVLVGRDWTWQLPAPASDLSGMNNLPSLEGQSFELRRAHGASPLEGTHTVSLLGRHQLDNATVAIAALDFLQRRGVSLRPQHLRRGLVNVRWPGRFEILCQDPLLIVDCAHNGDSAAKLVAGLDEWFPDRRWTFILGVSKDKDLAGILQVLAPRTERLLATQSRHARAMSPEKVAKLAAEILPQAGAPLADVQVTSDVSAALNLALNNNTPWNDSSSIPALPEQRNTREQSSPICVTGSIFVVADVREVWALYAGWDLPETDHPIAHGLLPLGHDPAVQMETI